MSIATLQTPIAARLRELAHVTGIEPWELETMTVCEFAARVEAMRAAAETFPEEVDDAQAEIDMDAGDERRDCLGLAVHGRSTGWEP